MEIPEEQILAAVKPTMIFPMREVHDSPLGKELIKIGKKVGEILELEGVVTGSLSTTYGKGFIITADNSDLKKLDTQAIIEILDYDPVRNNIIARGKRDSCMETPLHWFIYRAFPETSAIIHIRNNILVEKITAANLQDLAITPFKVKYITSELAMEILKLLKGQNIILLQENGVVAIADSLENAYNFIAELNKKVTNK